MDRSALWGGIASRFCPTLLAARELLLAVALTSVPLVASAGGLAVVTNQGGDSVSIVELIAVPSGAPARVRNVAVGHAPAGVAVDVTRRRAFVSNAEGRSVSVVDVASGRATLEQAVGAGPVGIAHDPVLRRVYVADWYRNSLWVLRDDDLGTVAEVAVGRAPAGVEVSADGTRVYVAERDDDAVAVVDAGSLAVVARHSVGSHPFGVRLAPDGAALWVSNVQSHDVSVIALEGGGGERRVGVGHRPYCVAFAAGRAFVSNQYGDSVSVIDAASLETLATLPLVTYPEGIDSDGTTVWVVSWMDEQMVGIDAKSLQRVATIPLGRNPRGFGRFVLAE